MALDAIHAIIEHSYGFRSADLPATTAAVTKRFILDALAVMMAGTRAAGCDRIARYVSAWQGRPDAELVTGGRAAMPYAALANSMMAHAVEFDDTYEPADVHAFAVVLPAILAMAELEGSRAAGPDIIAACAIGVDLAYRLGAAIKTYRGWHPTATCGIFGATAAAARIAGCDTAQLQNAFGIAYSLAAGNFQAVVDASLSKRMQPGFAARGAVEAVLLARAGLTGAVDILEGTFGFYPLYECGEYDRAALLDGLGERYLTDRASMKPYPCCRFCHAAIDAALAIRADPLFPAAEALSILAVQVEIPAETFDYVGRPFEHGDNPQVAAQFSVPYTVAAALLRGEVGLDTFSRDAVSDRQVVQFAQRVTAVPMHGRGRYGEVSVSIQLRSGVVLQRRIGTMKGEPGNPLSDDEHRKKLFGCIRYGKFPESTVEALIGWAESLDCQPAPVPALHSVFRSRAQT